MPEEPFDFEGRIARVQADFSVSWDSGGLRDDGELVKMLAAFDAYLDRLAQDPDRRSERRKVLELLASENRYAVLWKRLIAAGVRVPQTLGRDIRALAWAAPILAGRDTTVAIGDLLNAIFTIIEPDERKMVEHAILAISTVTADGREFGITTRNRLLGCLPVDALVTEEARETIASLGPGDVPKNAPLFRANRVESAPFGEAEFLSMEGVPVDEAPNRHIRDLARSVEEFAREHLNDIPLSERIEAIFPKLQALDAALKTAVVDGVHERQQDHAGGHLTEACERAARSAQLSCDSEIGSFVRTILLRASEQPFPEYHPESDEHFDESPYWGRPSARVDAAIGLMRLAGREDCADAAVLAAVERLSQDSVPAVRLHIARSLHGLYATAPELMWHIIERLCRDEPRRAVLTDLIRGPLDALIGPHTNRVILLALGSVDEYC